MQLSTSGSTVTTGQSATVTWSLDDHEKANPIVGILIVFDGENPQDVANQLVMRNYRYNPDWRNTVNVKGPVPGRLVLAKELNAEDVEHVFD